MQLGMGQKLKQLSLFDTPVFKIKNKIRLIELFGGIGSQAMALRDIGADFEHHRLVEFDPYPVKSYNAIHGTDFKPMDITKITAEDLGITDTDKYTYVMTYSFPCTDLSIAGKMEGMQRNSGTRSGLLWEVERLLKELHSKGKEYLPQVLLMENVIQVHSEGPNLESFRDWIRFLGSIGYASTYKDLKATDYEIPQSRIRCFMVSILGDYEYEWPDPVKLEKTMKDFLEDKVADKYYLSQKMIDCFERLRIRNEAKGYGFGWQPKDMNRTEQNRTEQQTPYAQHRQLEQTTILLSKNKVIKEGFIKRGKGKKHQSNTVYAPKGLCPTLCAEELIRSPVKIIIDDIN